MMKEQELISVIVPIYRVEQYLKKCIYSIVNQTYRNLEIILVDDGSDDKCGKICDEFAKKDNRIRVIHKKNEGLDEARKSGFRISTGTYIGYVDSDDWIELNMYETMMRDALEHDVDVVECGVIDSWEGYEKERIPYLGHGVYKEEQFRKVIFPNALYTGEFFSSGITPYLCNKIFRKSIIKKYQLWEDKVQALLNDNLVTYPAILESQSLFVENKCFYHYRVNNNSIKHTPKKENLFVFLSIEKAYNSRLNSFLMDNEFRYQIKTYTLYHYLCRIPYIFDDKTECLVPYGGIPLKSKLVLYGAGSAGVHLKEYLSTKDVDIVSWVDSRYESFDSSFKITNPRNIVREEFDYVIISVMRATAVQSIKKDLGDLGIKDEKIKWIKQEYIDYPDLLLQKAYNNTLYMEKKRENE